MIRGILINEDGRIDQIELVEKLEAYQHLVGGDIEAAPLRDGSLTAYIHAEGKFSGKKHNRVASALCTLLAGDYIAGPMLVLGPLDEDGEDTSIAPEQVERIRQVAARGA